MTIVPFVDYNFSVARWEFTGHTSTEVFVVKRQAIVDSLYGFELSYAECHVGNSSVGLVGMLLYWAVVLRWY